MQQARLDDDLYSLLGVRADASMDEIRRAYRKRAMIFHPDRNRLPAAEETFKRIRYAYEVLRDPERRAQYDGNPASFDEHPEDAAAQPADSPGPPPTRAPDLTRRVRITLGEQLSGCRVKLKLTRTEYCQRCDGSGISDAAPITCITCRGAGELSRSFGLFSIFGAGTIACADCGGAGSVRAQCEACAGSGTDARKVGHLRFEIPAGTRPGAKLRVRGHGRRGRSGEVSGDLLVHVEIAPHPLFEPDFPHLRCAVPVSVFRALAEGSVEVPTLAAPISVPLPVDVVDGTELLIPGHGMLDAATGTRGDLLIGVRLIRPGSLTERQRELLAELERDASAEAAFIDWAERQRAASDKPRPDRDRG